MEAIFDNAAATYDSSFTNSHSGRMQRARVWQFLNEYALDDEINNILEVNCGTGEDAVYLANLGKRVIATDISKNMIEEANSKLKMLKGKGSATFEQKDIISTFDKYREKKFDLIFSNFGGFNCLSASELTEAISKASELLTEKGSIVAVVMPQFCLQESIYFYLKGRPDKAKRRSSDKGILADINGVKMTTHYYDPSFFNRFPDLVIKKSLPVGFFLPPSYLEPFYQPKKVLMKSVYLLEKMVKSFRFLSRFSDHYFIQLQKRK